ncbi:MAG: hypothetical protein JXB48_14415 [Candidatus Latescibacteria bacterium]|nr:hypothetical protein [Candidatus Latescibacterota bacterium]
MLTIETLTISEMETLVGGQCNCNPSTPSCPGKCAPEPIMTPGSQTQANCNCWAYTIYEDNGC